MIDAENLCSCGGSCPYPHENYFDNCYSSFKASNPLLASFNLWEIIAQSNPIPTKYKFESSLGINDDDDPNSSGAGGAPYLDSIGEVDYVVLDGILENLISELNGMFSIYD